MKPLVLSKVRDRTAKTIGPKQNDREEEGGKCDQRHTFLEQVRRTNLVRWALIPARRDDSIGARFQCRYQRQDNLAQPPTSLYVP
jgi:hypothetical protein